MALGEQQILYVLIFEDMTQDEDGAYICDRSSCWVMVAFDMLRLFWVSLPPSM